MNKILVIEDDLNVRTYIIELLELEEFEVIVAESSLVGVQLAQQNLPDLILCDVMMPGLDGYGVLRALRQNSATATIPFIFLTSKASKADQRLGMELGADDYLTKPFSCEELLGAIAARLKKQSAINQQYASLNQLAYYDLKTHLPNRLLLGERFHQLLAESKGRELCIPILYIDLDRFHRVNDTLGDSYGGLLLKAVAERLQACLSSQDILAHLNNDQFAVILAPVLAQEKQDASAVHAGVISAVQNLIDQLSRPFSLRSIEVFVTASIGIAFYPQDGREVDPLIRHADIAMSQAKRQGGNHYQVYTPAIESSSVHQLVLEASLHHALEKDELRLYYQPLVDSQTEAIIGAEALLRWQHSERGLVSPADFMPQAEATGLIVPIGEWVLRTACRQAKVWQAAGYLHLQVSVNLSPRQFSQPNLSKKVAEILQETDLQPAILELEVTEKCLMQGDISTTVAKLDQLRELGVSISIDDFGTGYSSLNYLQQFPFDTLKIDSCFVRNIAENAKNAAITTAIIQMAHQLNLWVVAEGVETRAESAFLRQYGCDGLQGFWFSRPLLAEDFSNLLKTSKRPNATPTT